MPSKWIRYSHPIGELLTFYINSNISIISFNPYY